MKKKSAAQKSLFSFSGYLMFFLLVSAVATCSILAYTVIIEKSGGNKVFTAIVTLIVLVLLALIFTIIDFFRRKYTVERPVERIITATERITCGDFSVKLKPNHIFGRYNEFDVIMENINQMTAELSKNELLKNDFIANVSHEIKSPLAIIQNYVMMLCKKNLSEEVRQEYGKTLQAATKRLSDLISNILKLNKLENQEIFPKKTHVELGELIRECVFGFEDKFEDKQVEVSCDIEDMNVLSDAGFLEIVLSNLISNAVKFSENCGKVSISLKEDGDFASITVADCGCGIPPNVGNQIFDKFYQADPSRACEGNGLGLALVKRVIDILGGEIVVCSEENVGTSFTVKIKKY